MKSNKCDQSFRNDTTRAETRSIFIQVQVHSKLPMFEFYEFRFSSFYRVYAEVQAIFVKFRISSKLDKLSSRSKSGVFVFESSSSSHSAQNK